ncbi:MAG: hypothetical protein PUG61_09730 [Sarcina ventriculi]|nr:hypothetical protein [Sarcina ventriculi]
MYRDSKGWITKAKISDKGYEQWHYKYKDLIELRFDEDNVYITLNNLCQFLILLLIVEEDYI